VAIFGIGWGSIRGGGSRCPGAGGYTYTGGGHTGYAGYTTTGYAGGQYTTGSTYTGGPQPGRQAAAQSGRATTPNPATQHR
jgi:hypothetical protein